MSPSSVKKSRTARILRARPTPDCGRKLNFIRFCLPKDDLNLPTPPQIISLRRYPAQTAIYLRSLESALKDRPKAYIDLSMVKMLDPGAALVMYSLLERHSQRNGNSIIARRASEWSPSLLSYVMEHGIFWSLKCKLSTYQKRICHYSKNSARAFSSTTSVKDDEKIIDQFQSALHYHMHRVNIDSMIVEGIISELVANVRGHAYPNYSLNISKAKFQDRRWWMSYEISKHLFTFSFYDCGIGIPTAVKHAYSNNTNNPYLKLSTSKILAEATQTRLTSSLQKNRGRGLPGILRDTTTNHGIMRINSHNGECTYKIINKPVVKTRKTSLSGTFIQLTFRSNE